MHKKTQDVLDPVVFLDWHIMTETSGLNVSIFTICIIYIRGVSVMN